MEYIRFELLIQTGFVIACLMEEAKDLCDSCHYRYNIFILANKHGVWVDKVECKRHKREMLAMMKNKILEINKHVSLYNENMTKINPSLKLDEIKYSTLNKELSPYFERTEESNNTNEKLLPYLISSFDSYVSGKVSPLLNMLAFNKDITDLSIKSFELVDVNEQFRNRMYEVIDLQLMGYKSTSLLVLGRIYEEIITKYLLKLNEESKIVIANEAIINMRFENKLGFLKSRGFISEKDWLIISKIKFDRKIGGHFVDIESKAEAEMESEATIKLAIKLINKFDKKLRAG